MMVVMEGSRFMSKAFIIIWQPSSSPPDGEAPVIHTVQELIAITQVRETETWMPMNTSMTTHPEDLGSSAATVSTGQDQAMPPAMPDANAIPDLPAKPTVDEVVQSNNEIHLLRDGVLSPGEEQPSNVLMSHANQESIFNKTEVLAALIAGSAVGLMFAVLLVLLLIYRMKKKDEGSYDLGKKPIYKKAPTTEIYA
ncbi:hypothetical protein NHX12_030252 [Muraenolepis orangiensis]|uniref:Syndecan n=1 Tax=Muraenolepis orangiensis TaxID=630683 RepID=A0A9Q0E9S8_9TELE|nr:hypothetical protein NHX12_030252 [Muraenolepis orangiensis]